MSEKLNHCPVCLNANSNHFLEVKDHFQSGEDFQIRECLQCGFRYIDPRPETERIGGYYQSDDYISHGAQHNDLLSILYRIARRFTIRRKYSQIVGRLKPDCLLDYGCGTGDFLKYCQDKGIEVRGVEPNEKAREYARNIQRLTVFSSLQEAENEGKRFSCITLWHVLEHIHDLEVTLQKIIGLLAPGGMLVIAVPNCLSGDARKYGARWAAYDVPRHLYHFNPTTLELLMKRFGFEVMATQPQILDAYYISLLSEKYRTGKSRYLAAFFSGMMSNFQARNKGWGHSSMVFFLSAKKP